jgi:suppressor of G2 allele of SKP1
MYIAIGMYKMKKYDEALNILEKLKEDKTFEKDFYFYLTKAKIEFFLNKYVDCKMTLNEALKIINTNDRTNMLILTPWLNKIDIELKDAGILDYNVTNEGELKIIYKWIQTNATIEMEVTSNHNLNAYEIKFQNKLIDFIDKKENVSKYKVELTNAIKPEESSYKITSSMKCKITLKKGVEGFNWVNLETNNADSKSQKGVGGNYPSSGKVKRDWSQIDKDMDELEKEEAKLDGNEGMWRLFRDIYAKGNEETRRAMIKSFQTSGGTVLSTSWDDVKNKDYEGKDRPEAPEDQEWAKKE